MIAMDAGSQPSATSCATNARSLAWPPNPHALSAARNSRARLPATGTCNTRSASSDATHSRLASQLLNTSAVGAAARLYYYLRVHIFTKATRLNWIGSGVEGGLGCMLETERGLPCSQRYVYMDRESGGCCWRQPLLAYWALPQIGILGMGTPHLPHSL